MTTEEHDVGAPVVVDLPIGLPPGGERTEVDAMGSVEVPADRYWGAQTERARRLFAIGDRLLPAAVVHALGELKQAAAQANGASGRLPAWKADLIARVAGEVAAGALDEHFCAGVFQSGSGTSTNMNANEVIANRSIQLVGGELGSKVPVHPNDDVNLGQSSNDTFISAVHIATHRIITSSTLPALAGLRDTCVALAGRWEDVVRVGRTHLQDATPITVGQAFSAYAAALDDAHGALAVATDGLAALAIGGTAVGTGVNTTAGFGAEVCRRLSPSGATVFRPATNPFAAQSTLDALVRVHGALRDASVVTTKLANDIRWAGSGPRAGIGEFVLPANEPGSSIMPGKVNPTQAEALVMVGAQLAGADVTMGIAGAGGHFELNTLRPLAATTVVDSATILADGCNRFREFCLEGLELDRATIDGHLAGSVMLVTALVPVVGYDLATAIAQRASADGIPVREAAIALGVAPETFDAAVDPLAMTRPDPPTP